MPETKAETKAELVLPTTDLRADLPFFTKTLGMRMDMIYPADNPAVAVVSGHGLRLRLDAASTAPAGHLRLLSDDWASFAEGVDLAAAYRLVALGCLVGVAGFACVAVRRPSGRASTRR